MHSETFRAPIIIDSLIASEAATIHRVRQNNCQVDVQQQLTIPTYLLHSTYGALTILFPYNFRRFITCLQAMRNKS